MQSSLFEPGHLRPCPSYSRRRGRINVGLLRSCCKGGTYGLRCHFNECSAPRKSHALPQSPQKPLAPMCYHFWWVFTGRTFLVEGGGILKMLERTGVPTMVNLRDESQRSGRTAVRDPLFLVSTHATGQCHGWGRGLWWCWAMVATLTSCLSLTWSCSS